MYKRINVLGLFTVKVCLIFTAACVDLVELDSENAVDKISTEMIDDAKRLSDENNSQCVLDDLKCQQQCFYDHGQSFGTLSPFIIHV